MKGSLKKNQHSLLSNAFVQFEAERSSHYLLRLFYCFASLYRCRSQRLKDSNSAMAVKIVELSWCEVKFELGKFKILKLTDRSASAFLISKKLKVFREIQSSLVTNKESTVNL